MSIEVLISQGSIERDRLNRGFGGQESQSATGPMNVRVLKDTVSLILDSGTPQNCNFLGISFWEKKKARPRAVKRFVTCQTALQKRLAAKQAMGVVTHWPYLLAMSYSGPQHRSKPHARALKMGLRGGVLLNFFVLSNVATLVNLLFLLLTINLTLLIDLLRKLMELGLLGAAGTQALTRGNYRLVNNPEAIAARKESG